MPQGSVPVKQFCSLLGREYMVTVFRAAVLASTKCELLLCSLRLQRAECARPLLVLLCKRENGGRVGLNKAPAVVGVSVSMKLPLSNLPSKMARRKYSCILRFRQKMRGGVDHCVQLWERVCSRQIVGTK